MALRIEGYVIISADGRQVSCSVHGTADVVRAVRAVTTLPLIPKLTPNVTDISSIARAAEDAGADAVSLVNTFLAMAIDVETQRPRLSNIVGGLSGPAIRPIAVRMVYECRRAVKIPVIGMGGIADARDALEFMIAGAAAVQVGTANFVDPGIWPTLLEGITDYMKRHSIVRIGDRDQQCGKPGVVKIERDDCIESFAADLQREWLFASLIVDVDRRRCAHQSHARSLRDGQ